MELILRSQLLTITRTKDAVDFECSSCTEFTVYISVFSRVLYVAQ